MKGEETGGGDFISVCEPVVVVAYHLIIMKEVEDAGGDFTSFCEPVLSDYYERGGEGRRRLYFFISF